MQQKSLDRSRAIDFGLNLLASVYEDTFSVTYLVISMESEGCKSVACKLYVTGSL